MAASAKGETLPVSTASDQNGTIGAKEYSTGDVPNPGRHRRKRLICYGSCGAILVVIIIAIVVVSFTVYKVREPTMHVNAVDFGVLDLTKNLTVIADISVKNPNAVTFKFNSSMTSLLYRNHEVGSVYGPPETVRARRTLRTNVTVDVITERLLNDTHFMDDVGRGSLGLQTCTMVAGKVKILGVFRRHVDLMMNCSVNVSIATQAILDQYCTQQMWL